MSGEKTFLGLKTNGQKSFCDLISINSDNDDHNRGGRNLRNIEHEKDEDYGF